MKLGLALKLAIIILFLLAFSLALNSTLNLFSFGKTYRNIDQSRYLVVARAFRLAVEADGLPRHPAAPASPLATRAEELLDREDTVTALVLADAGGRILLRRGRAHPAALSPADLEAAASPGDAPDSDGDAPLLTPGQVGLLLRDDHAAPAGTLLLTYDTARADLVVAFMRYYLIALSGGLLLLFGAAVAGMVRWLTRDTVASFTRMEQSLQAVSEGGAPLLAEDQARGEMEGAFARTQAHLVDIHARLDRAEQTAIRDWGDETGEADA